MKDQKGITLIALVITIIVLLILAAVSIAMLTGPNGLLTQASEAGDKTTQAEQVERINLALDTIYSKLMSDEDATTEDIPEVKGYTIDKLPTTAFTEAQTGINSTTVKVTITSPDGIKGSIIGTDDGKGTCNITKAVLPE